MKYVFDNVINVSKYTVQLLYHNLVLKKNHAPQYRYIHSNAITHHFQSYDLISDSRGSIALFVGMLSVLLYGLDCPLYGYAVHSAFYRQPM